ncbi:MAG: hypothetical protein HKN23_12665 [Verrucomicrobiales bacterium]|nr:hypothetical protein [Verrucomicrobiales bacterium]
MTNDNEFELLSAFLQSVEPEVSGHSAGPVSDKEKSLISQFAKGELGDEETRATIVSTLLENERALQMLVDEASK